VGQIAGDSATRNDSTTHAFRFTPGQGMRDLGTLGGRKSSAYGINNLGEVVGESDFQLVNNPSTTAFVLPGTSLTGTHAFLWTEAKGMKDLGHLGGGYSIAQAINNNGEVVGYSTLPGGTRRAFRWSSFGGMKDLNTLLPSGSGWVLTEANDINDRGQVVGNGLHNGKSRAFRFTLPTATVLQADFDSDTFGPPKPAQKVGTVWVEPVDGTVSVIDAPMPDAPNKHWVRIGSPTVRSSLKGEFAGFNGDGSGNYTLTATMFIRNGTDTVTLQFEPGAFGPLSYLHFLHLDFTPQGDVQIDDGPKFGNYPKDLPFQIRVNLVINGGAAGIARISLSGGGASGNTEYTLPNQSLTFGRRFGAIRFWMVDGPGEFFVDNIVVTRRDL